MASFRVLYFGFLALFSPTRQLERIEKIVSDSLAAGAKLEVSWNTCTCIYLCPHLYRRLHLHLCMHLRVQLHLHLHLHLCLHLYLCLHPHLNLHLRLHLTFT